MGKGDRKTAKGKRFNSSYGNVRSHRVASTSAVTATSAVKKTTTKTVVGKPAVTKSAVKKVVKKVAA